jgi:hypothetical protein
VGEVVTFDPGRARRGGITAAQLDTFERWRLANLRAQATMEIEDAIAAGILWREWLESFKAISS